VASRPLVGNSSRSCGWCGVWSEKYIFYTEYYTTILINVSLNIFQRPPLESNWLIGSSYRNTDILMLFSISLSYIYSVYCVFIPWKQRDYILRVEDLGKNQDRNDSSCGSRWGSRWGSRSGSRPGSSGTKSGSVRVRQGPSGSNLTEPDCMGPHWPIVTHAGR